MDRRNFLRGSIAAAAGVQLGFDSPLQSPKPAANRQVSGATVGAGDIIDTNAYLCCWPYRSLKYGEAGELVAKLRHHGIQQAWAGSYDAIFHKNLDAVNRRLAENARVDGSGFLVPFGTVNPAWPDWEEDIRRADEDYSMPGLRLLPAYHGYGFDHPNFVRLLQIAADRGLLVQINILPADERMRHPSVVIPEVDATPLPAAMAQSPDTRVMLVNAFRDVRGERLKAVIDNTNAVFDIANLDGCGGLERIIAGTHWYLDSTIPADRLTFGSNAPYFPVENTLFKFVESELSTDDQRAILSGNAERMLTIA